MSLASSAPGSRRLLPAAWVTLAAAAWAASFVVLLALGYHLHRTGVGGPVDRALDARLTARLAEHRGLLSGLVLLGSPAVVVLGSVALAGVAAARRWRRAVALALLAAPLAGAATEFLLKPLIGVRKDPRAPYGFPSGHTTGAVALALVIVVLLLPRPGMHLGPAAVRVALGVLALVLAAGTAVAVVALGFHRTTDAVGGVATAVLVVLALAAVVDLAVAHR